MFAFLLLSEETIERRYLYGKKPINAYPKFYTTADVMKILKIGNRACLDLFHMADFPCVKVGRAFKISEENFREYFSTRRVND